MKPPYHPVSPVQLALLIGCMPLVAAMLQYDRMVLSLGTDGWWLTVLASVAVPSLLGLPILAMGRRVPSHTDPGGPQPVLGAGRLVALPVFLVSGFTTLMILRGMSTLVQLSLLPATPEYVIFLSACGVVGYLAAMGPVGLGRFAEIAMILIVGPFVLTILGMGFQNATPSYWGPWLAWPPGLLSSAGLGTFPYFLGLLPALLMLLPYLQTHIATSRPYAWALAIGTSLLLVAVAIPLGTYGPGGARLLHFPLLAALDSISINILFVQEMAVIAVSFWTLIFFLAAGLNLWSASQALMELVPTAWRRRPLLLFALIIGLALGNARIISAPTYHQAYGWWTLITLVGYAALQLVFWPAQWFRGHRHAH